MYENPSADKFGPPPASEVSRPDGRPRRRLSVALVAAIVYLAAHWLNAVRGGRGWLTALSAIVLLASTLIEYVFTRHRGDESDGGDPYSPPTSLTR